MGSINQDDVQRGKISLLTDMDKVIDENTEIELVDMLENSGFPDDIDFNPHGMALTPNWVSEDEK